MLGQEQLYTYMHVYCRCLEQRRYACHEKLLPGLTVLGDWSLKSQLYIKNVKLILAMCLCVFVNLTEVI